VPSLLLSDFPPWLLRIFAALFGLVWGSFLNVVIHRLPRGMSVARPASHCPSCHAPIPFYRNVPVLSWLLLRGKAACCGVAVSARYVLVELAGGVLSLAVLEATVLSLPGVVTAPHALAIYIANLALCLGLLAATFIDLEHMILPDSITIGGTVLGLFTFALRNMEMFDAALGAVVGFAVVWLPLVVGYAWLRGRPGMGLGDAKLVMLAGAWFGWDGALLVIGGGAIQGTLVVLLFSLVGYTPEEPEAVKQEREELRAELEALSDEDRALLEAELGKDPLAEEPEEGFFQARLAFGPFLILGILELLLIGRERITSWLFNI
jgi:leader peptidase (prepilin peptidase) / N-methyltransferase